MNFDLSKLNGHVNCITLAIFFLFFMYLLLSIEFECHHLLKFEFCTLLDLDLEIDLINVEKAPPVLKTGTILLWSSFFDVYKQTIWFCKFWIAIISATWKEKLLIFKLNPFPQETISLFLHMLSRKKERKMRILSRQYIYIAMPGQCVTTVLKDIERWRSIYF